ncbi:MAG: RCC1 domain-containing protein, partial [Nitrososphaerales archaeon]
TLAACSGGNAPTSTSTSTSSPTSASAAVVYRFGVVGNAGKIAQLELKRPTVVSGVTGNVVQIATSNSDGYALTSSGEVWAWGVGSYGELGDGQKSPYETRAVKVEFPAGVKIVSLPNPMPFDGALGIDSTGHVWGWGFNGAGDLCLAGFTELRPVQIPLSDVTSATGARTHSLFDSSGRVYACGSGDAGELGDGSTTSSATPTPVVGLPSTATVTALDSSWEGSGALLSNGDYYDWGYNPAGQLGDGSTADSDVPVHVDLPSTVRQVFQGGSGAGNGQTVAILSDGSVWAWGNNKDGQLGNGSTVNSDVPVRVKVPANTKFVKVNSGGYASYAIDSSGTLWAWGGNKNGQLGTGNGLPVETKPVEVGIHLTQVSSTASNVAGLSDTAKA